MGNKSIMYEKVEQFKFGEHLLLLLIQNTECIVVLDQKEIVKLEIDQYEMYNRIVWILQIYLLTHATEKNEFIESKIKQIARLENISFKNGSNDKLKTVDLSFLGTYIVSESATRYGLPMYSTLVNLSEFGTNFLSTDEQTYGANKSMENLL